MTQKLHLKAPDNWINDPNGFIYYKGQYHLFYQYFPFEPRWGKMHWGHAVSDDLVTWEHKGVALFPSKFTDQDGCFSGSAIEHDGKLFLYYTGIHYTEVNPENIHMCIPDKFESSQMMLTSEDGRKFDNFNDKKVIMYPIMDKSLGDATHTRDPKVWKGKDGWYMVLGTTIDHEQGKLLFYKSEDLYNWTYENSATREGFGWMWECPDYFEVNDQGVLIFSPMGIIKGSTIEEDQSMCMLVDFDEDTCQMEMTDQYQFIDYGFDLYAPQSTLDEKGRRVMIAWLRMPKAVDDRWNGMFCLPRIVEVENGHIYFRVHPDVKAGFTKKITSPKGVLPECYCVSVDLDEGDSLNIGGYQIAYIDRQIRTDRSAVFSEFTDRCCDFACPKISGKAHLDIYVEEHMVEVFINDGEYVISNVVYGMTEDVVAETKNELKIYISE